MQTASILAVSFFNVPLNLPHAATVAVRVIQRIDQLSPNSDASLAREVAIEIAETLAPYRLQGDPSQAEAMIVQADVLDRARELVVRIRAEELGSDRLGQAVRNLFECLGAGQEGADRGLDAGEDPNSLQRP